MVPSLRPTAIRMQSSSMRRPRDEIGRTFNQAPDPLQAAANKRGLDLESGALANNVLKVACTLQESQDLWWWEAGAMGGGWS